MVCGEEKMKNNTFKEIWDKFKGLENVVIPLHLAPDGDSLGSCTALKYLLEKKFKTNVKIISKDKLDESLMKISFTKEINLIINFLSLRLINSIIFTSE